MYETYYDKLQLYFGQENIQLHYIDTDGIVRSINTKNIIKGLINLEDTFDFSNSDENLELFTNKNEKVIGKIKLETPEKFWIDEFVALRSKAYSFICNGENTNKIGGISESYSKNFKLKNIKIV